jgi:hypothetical protein
MQSVRHAGKLTGEVAGDIVDGSRKAELLQVSRAPPPGRGAARPGRGAAPGRTARLALRSRF